MKKLGMGADSTKKKKSERKKKNTIKMPKKVDYGYFAQFSHLDIVEVFNTIEWNYILIVDVPTKDKKVKRRLFNLSYQGEEVFPEWYKNMNATSFKFKRNLAVDAVKAENDIR